MDDRELQELRSFRIINLLLLFGILLDVFTTEIGMHQGQSYEQNPVGISLLSRLQWEGTAVVLLIFLWVFYRAGILVVSHRRRLGWWLRLTVAIVTGVRWLVAVTAVLGIAGM